VKRADPHRRGLVRRFYGTFVRPYLWLQVEIGVCLLVGVVLGLADPLILRALIDRALGDADRGALLLLTGLLGVVFVFRAAFRALATWLYTYSGLRILFDLRWRVFEHVERLSPYFFRGERLGDILARLTSDVDVLQQAAAHTLVNAASDALTIAGILALLLYLDPLLTLALLAVLPLVLALVARVNRRVRDEGVRAREAYGGLLSFFEERLSGIRLVQEFRREKAESRRHVGVSRPVIESNLKLSMMGAVQITTVDLVNTAAFVLVFLIGGARVLSGALTVGTLVAYYTFASRLYRPLGSLIEVNVNLQVARASLARIYELLDQPPEIREDPRARAPRTVLGAIGLRDVALTWPDGTRVLRGVTLDVLPGKVVALVGASGSGKSTLAALVPRYLDPREGEILLDGVPVREWPLSALRAEVGLVPQETQLFHDTLAANLRLARPRATDSELLDALEAAGLAEFVATLPEGLGTMVGEQGLRLSGGERQRLALARALLKDPRVFILDEATSALDPRTERQVLDRFLLRARGRTVLLIAHRLTSLVEVDRIFVLGEGRILEEGGHQELYRAGGLYRRLYDDQLRKGAGPEAAEGRPECRRQPGPVEADL
jgi:ABC-type multidrug transport system fused ATPase/permease subunit